ncbi:hypothetical protein [Streptomyces sp. NEAU-174]|uniref:hypothetical protein n=1 Tax=Streptomyces sp. NEAU-174 TaxID=3458254 RepID=UPI004043C3E0
MSTDRLTNIKTRLADTGAVRQSDAITIARLRRELRNARPRITEVPATAERPMAPDSVPQPHAA